MFSRSGVTRFKDGKCTTHVGPGAYDVPSTLTDKAAHMKNKGHIWDDAAETPGPGAYTTEIAVDSEKSVCKLPKRNTDLAAKENRVPTPTKRSPRAHGEGKNSVPRVASRTTIVGQRKQGMLPEQVWQDAPPSAESIPQLNARLAQAQQVLAGHRWMWFAQALHIEAIGSFGQRCAADAGRKRLLRQASLEFFRRCASRMLQEASRQALIQALLLRREGARGRATELKEAKASLSLAENRIAQQEEVNTAMEKNVELYISQREELAKNLDDLHREIGGLRVQLRDAQDKICESQQEASQERQGLQAELAKLRADLADADHQQVLLKNRHEESLHQLKAEVLDMGLARDALKKVMEERAVQLENTFQKQVVELSNAKEVVQRQLEEAIVHSGQVSEDRDRLVSEVADLRTRLVELETQHHRLLKSCGDAEDTLRCEIAELGALKESSVCELTDLRSKHIEVCDAREVLVKEVDDLRLQLHSCEQTRLAVEVQRGKQEQQLKGELENATWQVTEFSNAKEVVERQLEETMSRCHQVSEDRDRLDSEAADLRNQLVELETQHAESLKSCDDAEAALRAKVAELGELKESSVHELTELRSMYTEASADRDRLDSEAAHLRTHLADLETQHKGLLKSRDDAEVALRSKVVELGALEESSVRELTELRSMHTEACDARGALATEVDDLRQQVKDAEQTELACKAQSREREKKMKIELESAMLQAFEDRVRLDSETADLRNQLAELDTQHKILLKGHGDVADTLKSKVAELGALKESSVCELAELRSLHTEACDARGALAKEVDDLRHQLKDAKQAGEVLEAESGDREKQLKDELGRAMLQVEELRGAVQDGQRAEEAAFSRHKEATQAVEAELYELRGSLQAAEAARLQAESTSELVAEKAAQQEELQRDLADAKGEVDMLKEDKAKLQAGMDNLQWVQKQADFFKKAKERAEQQLKENKMDTEHWKQKYEATDFDKDRAKTLEEDFRTLSGETTEIHRQNMEMLATLHKLTQQIEDMQLDHTSMRESNEILQAELDGVMGRTAQMAGHANHKQKIRYTMNLRDENARLREELAKARQRLMHVEDSRRFDSISSDPMVSVCALGTAPACGEQSPAPAAGRQSRTPARTPRSKEVMPSARGNGRAQGRNGSGSRGASGSAAAVASEEQLAAEARRRCQVQGRVLERVRGDYQHLLLLVEQAIAPAGSDDASEKLRDVVARQRSVIRVGHEAAASVTPAPPGAPLSPRTPQSRQRMGDASPPHSPLGNGEVEMYSLDAEVNVEVAAVNTSVG